MINLPSKHNSKLDGINEIWCNNILRKWKDYRDYLFIKSKRLSILNKSTSYPKSETISKTIKINPEQVVYLWTGGLPLKIRKRGWNVYVGNSLDITQDLHSNLIENLPSEYSLISKEITKSDEMLPKSNPPNPFMQTYVQPSTSKFFLTDQKIDSSNFCSDVIRIFNKIKESETYISLEDFAKGVFNGVYAFLKYRPDVDYNKQLTYLSGVIFLNGIDDYNKFTLLCNLIIPSGLFNFMISDDDYKNNFFDFFHQIIKKKVPYIEKGIPMQELNLIMQKWTEYLFIGVFPYEILIRIWDCYLLKGDVFIFEVAISIGICLQGLLQKEKLKTIREGLNCFPLYGKKEDELFKIIEGITIYNEYVKYFDDGKCGKEKGDLLHDI